LVIDEMMSTINKVYNWLLNVENEKIDFQFIEIPKLKYRKSLLSYSYSPQEEDDETLLNEEGVIEYNGSKWFICSDCGTLISEDEYFLTMKNFGVSLCSSCADYYDSYINGYSRSYSIEEKYDEDELEAWLDYMYKQNK
jgi:hypothetical protein